MEPNRGGFQEAVWCIRLAGYNCDPAHPQTLNAAQALIRIPLTNGNRVTSPHQLITIFFVDFLPILN